MTGAPNPFGHPRIPELIERIKGLEHERDFKLAPYTTFHIGGPADVLVNVHDETEAMRVLQAAQSTSVPLFVMGGGSNLLISDKGIRGCVVRLKGQLTEIHANPAGDEIWAGAGASFPKLTRLALGLGWTCALGWHGTPGQVGGALKMNAGTRLGEIGEVVEEIHAITHEGPRIFLKDEAQFSYRNTRLPDKVILTKARLKCTQHRSEQAADLLGKALQLAEKRKKTQPKLRSAGSIFKNPEGDFAGRLIEAVGLKGAEEGDARVSDTHANFIVNTGRAKAQDVFNLSLRIKREVFQKFNVSLEYEVKLVGDFND